MIRRPSPGEPRSVKLRQPSYDLRPCSLSIVQGMCELHHGYGGAGGTATYAFAVYENGSPVAAFAWQPPPPGAAKSVCPDAPHGVLSLSRMVAVPKSERRLNHISKPLRRQMMRMIDRGRWPILVTYSDEGQGHTGHVYKCSGWKKTTRTKQPFFVDGSGNRASAYAGGKTGSRSLSLGGYTFIQRWEHSVCDPLVKADTWIKNHGWKRVPVPGKVWKSGNAAFRYVRL